MDLVKWAQIENQQYEIADAYVRSLIPVNGGDWINKFAMNRDDGTLEAGPRIDFHQDGGNPDYATRLSSNNGVLTVGPYDGPFHEVAVLGGTSLRNYIRDLFYPIGSYYETSNASFNPNTAWGGTWVLENAGYVHVSGAASGGYPVSKANNDSGKGEKDGGTTDAILIQHRHVLNNLGKAEIPQLTSTKNTFVTSATVVSSHNGTINSSTSPATYNYIRCNASLGEPDTGRSSVVTAAAEASLRGETSNIAGAATSSPAGANMQPYINVYRWHRTA